MKIKRLPTILLAAFIVLGCTAVPVGAAEIPENTIPIFRISGQLDQTISGNSLVTTTDWFYLAANDTIKYDCAYTPKSASVDFGYIGPDSVFHYLNYTNGNIDESFKVSRSGQYILAIRNNESYSVIVTGTVKY